MSYIILWHIHKDEGSIKDANRKRKSRMEKSTPQKKVSETEVLSAVLSQAADKEMNIDILKFLAQHGDPAQKMDAMNKLISLQSSLASSASAVISVPGKNSV